MTAQHSPFEPASRCQFNNLLKGIRLRFKPFIDVKVEPQAVSVRQCKDAGQRLVQVSVPVDEASEDLDIICHLFRDAWSVVRIGEQVER